MENIDRLSNLLHLPADVYFVSTVRDVFDEYFAERGAFPMAHCGASMMRYEAPEWFAEVIYLPSDGPRYSPRVELGVIPEPFVDPRRNRIDVLHTTPIDSDLQTYNLTWRYTNSHEARHAFVRVRDEIMMLYTDPFLNDVSQLRILLEKRSLELDRQWKDEIQQHNDGIAKEAADAAFRAGEYASVVQILKVISPDSLSPVDRKRLDAARKRVQ